MKKLLVGIAGLILSCSALAQGVVGSGTINVTPGQPLTTYSSVYSFAGYGQISYTLNQSVAGPATIVISTSKFSIAGSGRGGGTTEQFTYVSGMSVTDSNGNVVGSWSPLLDTNGNAAYLGEYDSAAAFETTWTAPNLPVGSYTLTANLEGYYWHNGRVDYYGQRMLFAVSAD